LICDRTWTYELITETGGCELWIDGEIIFDMRNGYGDGRYFIAGEKNSITSFKK